jgi:phospho-N-acetylmuramoyl-pentapeptide-transferase
MNLITTMQIVPLSHIFAVAVFSFFLSMALTPIYTHFAFKFRWWKQARDTAITGEKAPIYHKLHAEKHKRNIPTMGGMVLIAAIAIVTLVFNLSRAQTYLPLFALVAAGAVGLMDDYINIRGSSGIAGMRGKIKFSLIFGVAVVGALYFYYKLGYNALHVPAVGDFSIGWLYIPLFILVVVSTANAVNITDGIVYPTLTQGH